jgi:hypothetical protein
MKKTILKITAMSLFAAAIIAAPAAARAQDATNAPVMSGQETPVKHKKHDTGPFHGKLSAIDKNAMTLMVGERTFEITSDTKITKDGQPATLSDGVVGEMVGGAFKKGADGKLVATTVSFGAKAADEKKKKKSANPGSTNSMTN